jgi:oxygen-dependent protoporphyrinogen oxidase
MPHPSFGFWENVQNFWSEPVFDTAFMSAIREFWKEPRDPKAVQDESIGEFFGRRLSPTMVDRVLSGVIHGIYAGDVYKLSAKSLFPKQYRDEATQGGIFRGIVQNRADGLEITRQEGEFLQEMKAFSWDPLLRATLRDTSVFTFKDGMGMLTDALTRKLWATENVEFRTSTPIKALKATDDNTGINVTTFKSPDGETYDNVVSSLSPAHLNALSPPNLMLAPETPSVSVMTVNLYFRQPDLHPPGFGYLIPRATPFDQNPERALGVTFDTAYSPSLKDADPSSWHVNDMDALHEQRAAGRMLNVNDFGWYNFPSKPVVQDNVPERGTKLTVMLGGHWWDGWPEFPDEKEGLAMARSVIKRHLNITQEPEAWMVNVQKDCIPQYTVGHEARLKAAHQNLLREYKGHLRVAGNWMQGVGVNDCLRSAYEVVKSLRDRREGTGLENVGTQDFVRLKPVRAGDREVEK